MKKKILTIIAAVSAIPALYAQNFVDEAYVDMRSGFGQTLSASSWDGRFHVDYLNIHAKGHIADNVTYVFRHRLTKPVYAADNPLNATDFAWITWQARPKFSLTAGKHPVWFGTFEFDADPIDIFYWSKSIADLNKYYTFGVTGTYELAPSQNISLQFSQSPLSQTLARCFGYSVYWNGSFAPWWHTAWSVNFLDNDAGNMMNYIVLGNRFTFGAFLFDAEFINKTAIGKSQSFLSDGAVIVNAKYRMEKLNLCLKGTYDGNSSENADSGLLPGGSWDLVVPAGYEATQVAAGAEYFPLGNGNLRLHAFCSWISTARKTGAIELGLTWRFDIFNRK